MNLLHMKHALEVAKAGSLGKASEVLLIAAPNISRSKKIRQVATAAADGATAALAACDYIEQK